MPGTFSGDESVEWMVEADHVRTASSRLYRPTRRRPRRVVQRGIDETDPGEYFTIEIKPPKDKGERRVFIEELREQVQGLDQGQALKFRLPIEDKRRNGGKPTRKQIVISWPGAATRTKTGS